MEVEIRKRRFTLDHRKALFAWDTKQLILADLHVGKSSHFRKAGYSLPGYSFHKDAEVLLELVSQFKPREVVFLGDLFHSSFNDEFIQWHHFVKENIKADLRLVVGNHDKVTVKKNDLLSEFMIDETYISEEFAFTHHPTDCGERLNVCGHLHPAVRLQGPGLQRMKVPCFWLSENQMVLPAFGELTGVAIIKPQESDRIYACTDDAVIQLG